DWRAEPRAVSVGLRGRVRRGAFEALALAVARGGAQHAFAHRAGGAEHAPVVEHAEGEDAGDVFAGLAVADGFDPDVRVHVPALRQPARGRGGTGVVGGDRHVGLAVHLLLLAQVGGA